MKAAKEHHEGGKTKKNITILSVAGLIALCIVISLIVSYIVKVPYRSTNVEAATITDQNLNTASPIRVDGIGYRPQDKKVAILVNPQTGFNAGQSYIPSSTLDLKLVSTNATVAQFSPVVWNGGATDTQSGDKVWHLDFSNYTTPGEYYLYDAGNNVSSEYFNIDDNVYHKALVEATRFYYRQRANYAKTEPYAQGHAIGVDYDNTGQDFQARYYLDINNPATEKDLSGGWWDAGDTNKYTNPAAVPVHQLLRAYTNDSSVWTDNFNIPESGNGIPDIIDEIKYELDYIKKLQDPSTGKVIIKVGYITYDDQGNSRPDQDPRLRYYGPVCSSSTISAAAMYAHGALVMKDIPALSSYAADLQARAIQAYNAFLSYGNTLEENCDDQTIKSGDGDMSSNDQKGTAAIAGIYLAMLTGTSDYDQVISDNISNTVAWNDIAWTAYGAQNGGALLDYLKYAQGSTTIQDSIRNRYLEIVQYWVPMLWKDAGTAYPAYMPDDQYHWGSNAVVANIGLANLEARDTNLLSSGNQQYYDRGLDHLHYMHALNALGMSMVLNGDSLNNLGLAYTPQKLYHQQFGDPVVYATKLAPAGYVVGGVNKNYSGSRSGEIAAYPVLKKYIDTNENWPISSWEFSEPGIYYQSAYVSLLSRFASPETTPISSGTTTGGSTTGSTTGGSTTGSTSGNTTTGSTTAGGTGSSTGSTGNTTTSSSTGSTPGSSSTGTGSTSSTTSGSNTTGGSTTNSSTSSSSNNGSPVSTKQNSPTTSQYSLVRTGGKIGLTLGWITLIIIVAFIIRNIRNRNKLKQKLR